jgi:hypothetical protein
MKKSPETTNIRLTRGNSEAAQGSSGGAACHRGSRSHLLAQGSSGGLWVTAAPVLTSRFRETLRPACVPWAPAPTSQHRAALGASRVLAAPGRIKTIEPSNTENIAIDDFFSTHLPAQGSSGGSACPRNSGPNENRQVDAENLAEPDRCKATPIRSKRNRAQRVAADNYQINPDPRW